MDAEHNPSGDIDWQATAESLRHQNALLSAQVQEYMDDALRFGRRMEQYGLALRELVDAADVRQVFAENEPPGRFNKAMLAARVALGENERT